MSTLAFAGENSLVNWKSDQQVSDMIPNSKFERFDAAGHLLFFEYPEKFNQLVTEFVSDKYLVK